MKSLATKPSATETVAARKAATAMPETSNRSFSTLSTYSPVLQRQCACGGGCPSCKDELGIQTKLKISEPGDMYEQEADRVADEVMRMPEPTAKLSHNQSQAENKNANTEGQRILSRITSLGQREEMTKNANPIQKKQSLANYTPEPTNSLSSQLNSSQSKGSPLPNDVLSFMEPRFGADFSKVRFYSDGDAMQMNRDLGAQAFTHGSDIYFGVGKSVGNNELTAHELTHVVQQTRFQTDRVSSSQLLTSNEHNSQIREPSVHQQQDVAKPSQVREIITTPIITRQLNPDMCSSDCDIPDGINRPKGKYQITIYADKEGSFLLIPFTSGVGHSWIELVDETGNYWTYGFWPQEGFDSSNKSADAEGCVHHPDTAHSPTSSQTFALTAAEFYAAKATAIDSCKTKPKYNLFKLQCTSFVRKVLSAAGKAPSGGFGLIWDSPNALDTWMRSNALLIGLKIAAATSNPRQQGQGSLAFSATYTHQFYSALGNKLRLHWMSTGELGSQVKSISTGTSIELTSQRIYLPSAYVFGGGTAGLLGSPNQTLGAGLTGSAGLLYNIDQLGVVGVEYNLVKDFVNQDPLLSRLMFSAGVRF
jgi:Domain of unknown function (DUF4157)